MVALRNITKNGNLVTCDYLPDGVDAGGIITVDATTYEIISYTEAKYDSSNPSMYKQLARRKIRELLQSGNPLPERAAIAIY